MKDRRPTHRWQDVQSKLSSKNEEKNSEPNYYPYKLKFSCPLGKNIMWWKGKNGLEYKECPLSAGQRDMPECQNCKLKIDQQWKDHKFDKIEDKPRKKNKNKRFRGN